MSQWRTRFLPFIAAPHVWHLYRLHAVVANEGFHLVSGQHAGDHSLLSLALHPPLMLAQGPALSLLLSFPPGLLVGGTPGAVRCPLPNGTLRLRKLVTCLYYRPAGPPRVLMVKMAEQVPALHRRSAFRAFIEGLHAVVA